MSSLHILRKSGAILAVGLLIFAAGCGKKTADVSGTAETTQSEKEVQVEDRGDKHSGKDVDLPKNFDNVIYVLEALTVADYVQGYNYYTDGDDNKEAFWFPMAVLSSLICEKEYGENNYDDGKYYCSKDMINTLASGLYEQYALGKMKIPSVDENSQVVVFDEESEKYGLLSGNIGDLSIEITSCDSKKDEYVISADLVNLEENLKLAAYQIELHPLKSNRLFEYAVADCKRSEGEDVSVSMDSTEASTAEGPSAEADFDEVDGIEITDDTTENDFDEYEEGQDEVIDNDYDSQDIDRDQALELAKAYMGDDASYIYKQMVTIGDYEYFDFSVSGEGISSTDILVCINGNDVVGAIQNEDGSWTFDQ